VAADFYTGEVWTRRGLQAFPGVVLYRALDAEGSHSCNRETSERTVDESSGSRPHRSHRWTVVEEAFLIHQSPAYNLVLFGEASLRKAVREFMGHRHIERNHQGLGNRLILMTDGPVQQPKRLGGLLNYYYRAA
jgi:hypothetical protein